jgi:triacylglycerol lipase
MGRFRRRTAVGASALGAVAVLLAGLLGAPPAESATHYPVIWSFLATATLSAIEHGPDVPPPGANLPCTPSAAHPYPVVLVHGLAGNENDNWQTLSPFLANNGYCVYALTYGNDAASPRPFNEIGGLSTMEQSAQVLARFVNSVLASTHAAKVDIVGHSEGGTMPDYYLKFLGGSKKVADFVSISGVLHGTTFWGLANLSNSASAYGFSNQAADLGGLCASCGEFLTGSAFLQKLDAPNAVATAGEAATCPFDGAAVDGVSYTSLATDNDELVRPPTSDFIDPRCASATYHITMHNILLQHQCSIDQADHLSIASDPVAAQDILNALDPAHQHPVRCTLVLPSIG